MMLAFGKTIKLAEQKINAPTPNEHAHSFRWHCDCNQFYLSVPNVARFLAIPEKNSIIFEKATEEISIHVLHTWLLGTMMAYMLQYKDYLVLHGSAVLINNKGVILSG